MGQACRDAARSQQTKAFAMTDWQVFWIVAPKVVLICGCHCISAQRLSKNGDNSAETGGG